VRGKLLGLALLAAACSSQPEYERPVVERPEVERPAVEPEGLSEMRDTLAAQRAEAREMENALLLSPDTMGAEPAMPWYESILWPIAEILHLIRNL
jgi:hypothetical protein